MNKYLKREYLFFVFLVVNLIAENLLFVSISKLLFYIILSVAVPLIILNYNTLIKGLVICPYFLFWILIYITYQFTVGFKYISIDNINFLLAKITTFCLLVVCVTKNYNFYFYKIFKPLGYIIIFLILIGWMRTNSLGVVTFGFSNRNAACAIGVIGFVCFLFNNIIPNKIDILCLFICALCILIGGSRNSLAMLVIILLIRYNISLKMIYRFICILFMLFAMIHLTNIQLLAIDRTIKTFQGTISLDREIARKAALWMISQHPWDGNGFKFDNNGIASDLTMLGSHNGYIDIVESMGYGFGGAWLITLAVGIISIMSLLGNYDLNIKAHLAIIISVLFAANQEAFLPGVNQIVTNMFFLSFYILNVYINEKHLKI